MPSPSGRRDHFLALPAFQRADLEGRVRVEGRSIAEHMTIVSKGSIATQRASSQQLHLRAESAPTALASGMTGVGAIAAAPMMCRGARSHSPRHTEEARRKSRQACRVRVCAPPRSRRSHRWRDGVNLKDLLRQIEPNAHYRAQFLNRLAQLTALLQMGFRQRPSWHADAVRGSVHPIIPFRARNCPHCPDLSADGRK